MQRKAGVWGWLLVAVGSDLGVLGQRRGQPLRLASARHGQLLRYMRFWLSAPRFGSYRPGV
jgi:hypothetical protein